MGRFLCLIVWLALLSAIPAFASGEGDLPASGEDLVATMEDTYRGFSFYSDTTISVLSVVSVSGEIMENENKYQFVFHDQNGALVDNYLGQMFLISGWESVTNWFKHPARYSVSMLDMANDWRDQFFPIGGMLNSEHPVMAMLLDRRTGKTDGTFPTVRGIDRITMVEYQGAPAIMLEGTFFFAAQGVNFDQSDQTPVPGKLWIDKKTNLLRKAEYDITAGYSKSFGEVRSARLTVTYEKIKTQSPKADILAGLFTFTPRDTDVKRDLSEIFMVAPLNKDDDGSQYYFLNRPAPIFAGTTLDGDNISLADYRGKRLLLFFWATWCPNCARAMSQIEQLANAGIENFSVIGVNVNSFVGKPRVEAYYRRKGLSFTSILDPENQVTSLYRGIVVPSAYVVDSYGIIRKVDLGETENLVERYTVFLKDVP